MAASELLVASHQLSTLDATASVAATLLGVSLAVVAILPIAFRGSPEGPAVITAALNRRRLRRYFIFLGACIPIFGIATILALVGLALSCDGLAVPAVATCAVGVTAAVVPAVALFFELLSSSSR